MKEELDSNVDESDEGMESEQEESDDDGMIKMDFSAKNKKALDVQKPAEKGITAMKFMKKSEEKAKEQIRADTETAIAQIKKEDKPFIRASNKFAGKGLDIPMHAASG